MDSRGSAPGGLVDVTVKIGAVDITAYVNEPTIRIDAKFGRSIDSATFEVKDHDGSLPTILPWQDITIVDAGDATNFRFGGIIVDIQDRFEGLTRVMRIACQDYTALLEKAFVPPKIYRAVSFADDAAIIADMFTAAFRDPLTQSDINEINTSTYVDSGRVIQQVVFNRTPLTKAMDTIAGNSGFEWYVDYRKNLHYHDFTTQRSAFDLSDDPDGSATFAISKLARDVDGFGLSNAIEVIGGWTLSSITNELITADNSKTEFATQYHWLSQTGAGLPTVERNDGTEGTPVWTAITMFSEGDSNYAAGANEATWNALQKTLIFGSAPPNLPNAIRVTGRYQIRVRSRVTAKESFDEIGRWVWHKIIDPNIFTLDEARLRAKQEMRERRFGVTIYTGDVERDGLDIGDRILLTHTLFGLTSGAFRVISRLRSQWLGNGVVRYGLTLQVPFGIQTGIAKE